MSGWAGIDVAGALTWGVLGTVAMTTVMAVGQGLGLSRISFPYLLGTAVTPRRDRAMAVGAAVHGLLGTALALPYAFVLHAWGGGGLWWKGAALGGIQGLATLSALFQLLPFLHPRMASTHHGPNPTRLLEPPGFLGLYYGTATPLLTWLAHVLYGLILGAGLGLSR